MRIVGVAFLLAGLAGPGGIAFAADEKAPPAAWVPYAVPASPGSQAMSKSAPAPWLATPHAAEDNAMKLKPGGACGRSELEVCFDANGRLTVPGAKRFLPEVPGLKPERLTVKRNAVQFSYSF